MNGCDSRPDFLKSGPVWALQTSRGLRIIDLIFSARFSGPTWLGLASGAGSVVLLLHLQERDHICSNWLVTLLSAPIGFLTEVFLSCKANVRKSVALPPVSPSFHYHPHHSIRTFSKYSFCRHLWSRCPWNTSRYCVIPKESDRCRARRHMFNM